MCAEGLRLGHPTWSDVALHAFYRAGFPGFCFSHTFVLIDARSHIVPERLNISTGGSLTGPAN